MKGVTIVKAKPSDIRDITKVLYLTWLDTYPNRKYHITVSDIHYKFKKRLTKEELEKRAERIRNQPKNELCLVAKYKNKVIGFCRALKDSKTNELTAIYILPEYHGTGIGKLLWKRTCLFFNNKSKTIVKVAIYNEKAIGFYNRLGFIETGKVIKNKKFRMRNGAVIPETKLVLKK